MPRRLVSSISATLDLLLTSVRRAVRGVMAAHRLQDGGAAHAAHGPGDKEKLREEVALRKAEAEKVGSRDTTQFLQERG